MELLPAVLGRDAEFKALPSGKQLLEFSLAVDIGFGDKKATEWVKCAVWAESRHGVAPYLTKGRNVTVSGRIKSNAYQGKDGLRSGDPVTCGTDAAGGDAKQAETAAKPAAKPEPVAAGADPDDEIHF
ncbi:MAG: single-stranded DNA-binding protein [Xanthomonadales bacterium]|nr:single-stranded DNA-binding protein [Xanthomonadales bacterium]